MSKKKDTELKSASKTFTTSVTDLDRIQEFLEAMAINGWILKSVSNTTYNFEKCEPKKVRYYVDFFNVEKNNKNSRYNYNGRKEYIQLCEEVGWNYVTNGNGLLFFYTEDMKLAPIKEDDEEKFKGICKYFILKNGGAPMCVLGILAFIVFAAVIVLNIVDGKLIYTIMCDSDYSDMYWGAFVIYLMFSGSTSIVKFILFYRKNKKQVAQGSKILYLNKKEDKILSKVNVVINVIWISVLLIHAAISDTIYGMLMFGIVLCLGIIGVVASVNEKKIFGHIKTHKEFQKRNFIELVLILAISSMIFLSIMGYRYSKNMLFSNKPELTITDVGVKLGKYKDEVITDRSRLTFFSTTNRFLIEYYTKDDDYGFDFRYEVFESKYKTALNEYKEHRLDDYDDIVYVGESEDKLKLNAQEVYYWEDKEEQGIMIVYKDKVIYIASDYKDKIDFSGKYVDVITEKLNK